MYRWRGLIAVILSYITLLQDIDDYFQGERDWAQDYAITTKDASNVSWAFGNL